MALKPASISVADRGGVTCIQLIGDIVVGEEVVDELHRAAWAIAEGPDEPRIAVSFSDVSYVASAIIGELISLSRLLRDRDARVRLCEMNEHIRSVFEVTRTTDMFDFCDALDGAVRSFGAGEPVGDG